MRLIHGPAIVSLLAVLAEWAPAPARAVNAIQRPPSARIVAPTIVSPAENAVVTGSLEIVLEVPPDVAARQYTLECSYWDQTKNSWVYPGTLGPAIAGAQSARATIAIGQLTRLSPTATRWRIHARLSDPPGPWGSWRAFAIQLPARPTSTLQAELTAALQEESVQYVIAACSRMLKGDKQRSLAQFAATLDSLRGQKQQVVAEIGAQTKRLQASCGCPEQAARCAQLVSNLRVLRRDHSNWLSAVGSRVTRSSSASAAELKKLTDAMTPGGQGALNIAFFIMMTIAELPGTYCIGL